MARRIDVLEEFGDITLEVALREVAEPRWRPMRCYKSNMCQARKAVADLSSAVQTTRPEGHAGGPVLYSEVTPAHLKSAVVGWRKAGLSAVTTNRRAVCLSVLGFDMKSLYTPNPRKLKWWLKPDQQELLIARLLRRGDRLDRMMVHYIIWATQTGLRVEESLRLTRSDFSEMLDGRIIVTVPGLKTHDSQATLPLSDKAAEVYRSRLAHATDPSARLFDVSYAHLANRWRQCRAMLGVEDNPLATLKALRRVAARNLHVGKGMPLDVVKFYLRHENVQTTMGYLRLTGGYGADEIARYL